MCPSLLIAVYSLIGDRYNMDSAENPTGQPRQPRMRAPTITIDTTDHQMATAPKLPAFINKGLLKVPEARSEEDEYTVRGCATDANQLADRINHPESGQFLSVPSADGAKRDCVKEDDFQDDHNVFAFTPGQLSKMFDPKCLSAFYRLGRISGIEKGLRSDRTTGLSAEETAPTGRVTFGDHHDTSSSVRGIMKGLVCGGEPEIKPEGGSLACFGESNRPIDTTKPRESYLPSDPDELGGPHVVNPAYVCFPGGSGSDEAMNHTPIRTIPDGLELVADSPPEVFASRQAAHKSKFSGSLEDDPEKENSRPTGECYASSTLWPRMCEPVAPRRMGRRNLQSSSLFKLLVAIIVALSPLAYADPNHAVYRMPRLLLLSGSAITSLVTGMTSLQLELPHNPEGTKFAKMSLRIACSIFLGALTVVYSLWFLSRAQKTQRFLYALCSIGLFLWIFVRRDAASGTADNDDAFAWLDDLNLFGLIAVVAGILNAESRLIVSAFAEEETENNGAGSARNPDESHRNNRNDEESQHQHRSPANSDRNNSSDNIGLTVFSAAIQTAVGA